MFSTTFVCFKVLTCSYIFYKPCLYYMAGRVRQFDLRQMLVLMTMFFCLILFICFIDCIFPWTMSLLCGRIWFEIANPLFGSMLVCLFVYHNLFICLFDSFFIMWVGLVWDCIPAVFKYLWPVFLSIAWFDYQRNDPPTNWVDW